MIQFPVGGIQTFYGIGSVNDLIRKNPFDFELAKVLINDSVKRNPLTPKLERDFLNFIKEDGDFGRFYDGMFILFHTGCTVDRAYRKEALELLETVISKLK